LKTRTSFPETESENSIPDPESLIKSIAEQGYSLETALADLIDNSISATADKVELLIDFQGEPFTLFLADNGMGMSEPELSRNMQFPSSSPDSQRLKGDLGRFGLGMKTASFSQSRCFTVLSRKAGKKKYSGRTWDVQFLKQYGWKIKVNSQEEVEEMLAQYSRLSLGYHEAFKGFAPNTIIVWQGLFKFEDHIDDKQRRRTTLQQEITEITSDYLALVFHKFMEDSSRPLAIRINNVQIKPFNPFPTNPENNIRRIESKAKAFKNESVKVEGFVLPARSIDESKSGLSVWTTRNKGLMDMEGIYVYRADRIIIFGTWLGLIKKGPRLQLARIRIDVGNSIDKFLHLNVAKSQIQIPHDLVKPMEDYVEELKVQAEREFYNRNITKWPIKSKQKNLHLFEKRPSTKGVLLEINNQFPLLISLHEELTSSQFARVSALMKMINTQINKIRQTHDDHQFTGIVDDDGIALETIMLCISECEKRGLSAQEIKRDILPAFGFKSNSYPLEILNLLKNI
jgi:hypothetical protein